MRTGDASRAVIMNSVLCGQRNACAYATAPSRTCSWPYVHNCTFLPSSKFNKPCNVSTRTSSYSKSPWLTCRPAREIVKSAANPAYIRFCFSIALRTATQSMLSRRDFECLYGDLLRLLLRLRRLSSRLGLLARSCSRSLDGL